MPKTKIEWSNIFAATALLVSVLSLWQSHQSAVQNLPALSVNEDQVVGGPYFNPKLKRWQALVYARFIITNSGGRSTALRGLEQNLGVPIIVAVNGNRVNRTPNFAAKFLILQDFPETIRRNPENIAEQDSLSAEQLRNLDIPVESGATKAVILGIVVDAYDDQSFRRADEILVALDLVFANGYRHSFLGAFPISAVPAGPPTQPPN